ncbi:ASST-domain-containing protein [Aspergillus aurantiobrunneus]
MKLPPLLLLPTTILATQPFHTTPLTAPSLNISKPVPTAPGLFISPSSESSSFPAIYSDTGDLLWHGPQGKIYAYQPQSLKGEPVLTFCILNASYHEIHRVTLPRTPSDPFVTATDKSFPSYIDIHESAITEDGTILVTAVNVTQADLSPVGGDRRGWVQDGLVYEIDIETNKVLFRWSAVEHGKELTLGYVEYPLDGKGGDRSTPYEYPHLNSVAKYMCSAFLLDKNGDIVWLLHEEHSACPPTPLQTSATNTMPASAHTNPGQPNEAITLSLHNSDNTETSTPQRPTTNMIFNLYPGNKTTALSRRGTTYPSHGTATISRGSSVPKFEEYDAAGRLVMRGWFGAKNESSGTYSWTSYRAFRAEWIGRPTGAPDVVTCRAGEQVRVYVSWNGATDVTSWRVWGSSSSSQEIKVLDEVVKSGVDSVAVEAAGGVGDGVRSKVVGVQSCPSL